MASDTSGALRWIAAATAVPVASVAVYVALTILWNLQRHLGIVSQDDMISMILFSVATNAGAAAAGVFAGASIAPDKNHGARLASWLSIVLAFIVIVLFSDYLRMGPMWRLWSFAGWVAGCIITRRAFAPRAV